MARFGKRQNIIWILLTVIVLQFIALAAVLVHQQTPDADGSSPQTEELRSDEQMPQWLQPAPEQEPAPEPDKPAKEPVPQRTAEEILSESRLIMHGLGEIADTTTLNCLEGFLAYYEQGARVFEADLRLTSDQQVVLRHDWRALWQDGISETSIPDLESFLKRPLLGEYTPLSFRDLLKLMEEYPDICVITDTKLTDAEVVTMQFEAMLRDAEELGLTHLLDRIAVQVYSPLMHTVVDHIYPFSCYIYTLYAEGFNRSDNSFREKAAFCQEAGIAAITMWDYWWKDSFAPIAEESGVTVYVHTVNEAEDALTLLESGVSGIYTDSLTEEQLAAVISSETEEGDTEHGTDGKNTDQ